MIAIHDMRGGGAERVVSVMCNQFTQMGVEVCLCYTSNNRNPSVYRLDKRVEVFYSKSRVLDCFNWMMGKIYLMTALELMVRKRRIRKKAKSFRPAVVLAVMEGPCRLMLQSIGDLDIPVVLRACNSIEDQITVNPKLLGKFSDIYKELSGIVYQTPDQQRQYESLFVFSPDVRKAVIQNPVEHSPLWETERVPEYGEIVAVGRDHRQKDYPLMFSAFKKAEEQFPGWTLSVYGTLQKKSDLPALITQLELDGKVRLCGFCPDVFERIRNASFFVMSSKYEGLPNALLEALCLGIPCITTDFGGGGAATLISDGKNGVIVPVGDEGALTDAMRRLMGDPAFAEKLGNEAKLLRHSFAAEEIASRWLDFLNLRV